MTEQEELALAVEMSRTTTGRSEVVGNVGCLTVYLHCIVLLIKLRLLIKARIFRYSLFIPSVRRGCV